MDYKEYFSNISLLKWGTLGMDVQVIYRRDSHHQEPRKAKRLRFFMGTACEKPALLAPHLRLLVSGSVR